jgi:hypothetical protein
VKSDRKPRPKTGTERPTSLAEILSAPLLPARPPRNVPRGYDPEIAAALVPLELMNDVSGYRARLRLSASRWLDQVIARAITRAERRTRRVPWHVGHGVEWVMSERRQIAYDVVRALTAHQAGEALARRLAELAAKRFPRDGVILEPEDKKRRPRLEGTNPRAGGDNPRATGSNPRAVGDSPRQRRVRAQSSHESNDPDVMAALSSGRD